MSSSSNGLGVRLVCGREAEGREALVISIVVLKSVIMGHMWGTMIAGILS